MIVREGKVDAEEYVGYQDNATRRPVDRDTIYHWASITKTFTGIAIMQLRGGDQEMFLFLRSHVAGLDPEILKKDLLLLS